MERRAGAYARFRRLASCTKLPNTEGLAVKSTDLMLLSNVKPSNPYQPWTWRSMAGHESMAYSYIKQQWTKGGAEFHGWLRNEAIGWRKEPVVKRLLRPTRLDRARRLGYK